MIVECSYSRINNLLARSKIIDVLKKSLNKLSYCLKFHFYGVKHCQNNIRHQFKKRTGPAQREKN
jgi:hypothetical protein